MFLAVVKLPITSQIGIASSPFRNTMIGLASRAILNRRCEGTGKSVPDFSIIAPLITFAGRSIVSLQNSLLVAA